MPPRTSWSTLLPGLIALAVVFAIAVGVIAFGGVARVRGDTMRLFVVTNQAQGIIGGTDVWLVGQKIGTVEGVEFRGPTDDSARVVLKLSVREADVGQVRHDSRVTLRTGGNIIGPAVVWITAGTPGAPAVRAGDTLRASPQRDLELATAQIGILTEQLPLVLADVKTIMGHFRNRRGTIGQALADNGDGEVARFRYELDRFRSRDFGSALLPTAAMDRARIALARVDSIRALVSSPSTSFGRFRRDASLQATVASIRDEIAVVRARMDSSEGSLPRWSRDSSITRALANAQREMKLLSDDIRRRPGRYINF
jgi:hypothetical protein